jgi:hypothetical protein
MRFGSAVSGKKEAVDRVAEMAIRFGMLDVVRLRNKIPQVRLRRYVK